MSSFLLMMSDLLLFNCVCVCVRVCVYAHSTQRFCLFAEQARTFCSAARHSHMARNAAKPDSVSHTSHTLSRTCLTLSRVSHPTSHTPTQGHAKSHPAPHLAAVVNFGRPPILTLPLLLLLGHQRGAQQTVVVARGRVFAVLVIFVWAQPLMDTGILARTYVRAHVRRNACIRSQAEVCVSVKRDLL